MIPTALTLTLEQCVEVVAYYSTLMRLEAWDIDLRMVRGYEIPESNARVHWSLNKRRASIRILEPNDQLPDADKVDMEQVIVHELTHVSLAYVDDFARGESGERNSLLIEAALENHVEAMAWALVKLRREGTHEFSYETETE